MFEVMTAALACCTLHIAIARGVDNNNNKQHTTNGNTRHQTTTSPKQPQCTTTPNNKQTNKPSNKHTNKQTHTQTTFNNNFNYTNININDPRGRGDPNMHLRVDTPTRDPSPKSWEESILANV